MNSIPEKHGPHSSPWEPAGARQTMQTGGRTRSVAERNAARQNGACAGPMSLIPIMHIIMRRRGAEETP